METKQIKKELMEIYHHREKDCKDMDKVLVLAEKIERGENKMENKTREDEIEDKITKVRGALSDLECDELLNNELIKECFERMTTLWYDLPRLLKKPKHFPKPEYDKCNAGHQLVEVFNEKYNRYDWDCPICIKKMQGDEQ